MIGIELVPARVTSIKSKNRTYKYLDTWMGPRKSQTQGICLNLRIWFIQHVKKTEQFLLAINDCGFKLQDWGGRSRAGGCNSSPSSPSTNVSTCQKDGRVLIGNKWFMLQDLGWRSRAGGCNSSPSPPSSSSAPSPLLGSSPPATKSKSIPIDVSGM